MHATQDTPLPSDLLAGRTILVTGASQGLGRAVALAAAAHGATVVLLARNIKRLEAVYDDILAAGGPEPAAIPLDLLTASDDDFNAVAVKIHQELGQLDGIVHCASHFYALSPLENQGIDEWMNQFRINTVAPAALTRACLPLLKASADASVLAVGETHGLHPGPFWGGFAVSHAGLPHWVRMAASEWDNQPNLRINLLIPGPVQSPQRVRTHPGEAKTALPPADSLMPAFLYWLGPQSQGQSGQIIELNPQR
ncbi:NAD(P)-dependent oxidoreductase [Aquaspirillum sp. LM1]|jgi:NAD(P)-dependent dehydrogenase (short-subunit alcohol dehydrogenase family)|uniref:SDR family oxidoreductase n=1 Tax=Aquaspirillum sp. LM1 TaxID=1938604 RepID=UPI0009838C88|nr:SDR family oxidoreductase [Aquaspirillum sp. LM1]AQR65046.1 NAD(P)-dependent oxidoreductase [Aquaspirillum sp. LM1]